MKNFHFKLKNIQRKLQGLPPQTIEQWRFIGVLMARSIVARRIYGIIAMGVTYDRSVEGLYRTLKPINEDEGDSVFTEDEIVAGLAELVEYGLLDTDHRPRMLLDLVP